MESLIKKFANSLINLIDQWRLFYGIETPYTIQIINIRQYKNLYFINFIIKPSGLINQNNQEQFNRQLLSLSPFPKSNVKTKIYPNRTLVSLSFVIDDLSLDILPSEIIKEILLPLPYETIKNYCDIKPHICASDTFWSDKLRLETGIRLPYIPGRMENIYLNVFTLWGFGVNENYELGIPAKEVRIPTQMFVYGKPFKVKEISTGATHSLIIDMNDDVWAFGDNEYGQLGRNTDQEPSLPYPVRGIKGKKLACGDNSSFIIDLENNLWGFGYNDDRQLATDKDFIIETPILILNNVKSVSSSRWHTILIDLDDNVWTFGNNESGQLGLGYISDWAATPQKVLVNNQPFKAKLSSSQGLIVDLENNLWAFGSNIYGELGLGHDNPVLSPQQVIINETPFKAKFVDSRERYSLVIDMDDNLWYFGSFLNEEIMLGKDLPYGIPLQFGKRMITINGIPFKMKFVSCGYGHALIIDLDNNLWGMGRNTNGELGLQNQIYNEPTPIRINNQQAKVITCSAGGGYSLISYLY